MCEEGATIDPETWWGRYEWPFGLANPRGAVGSEESEPIWMRIGDGTRRSGRGQRHIRQHMGARAGIIMPVVLKASGAVRVRAVSVMGASQTDTRACVNS